ncbi:MAG: hypothetical protein AAFN40_20070 [Cyanobacteria bacterium J06560_6]
MDKTASSDNQTTDSRDVEQLIYDIAEQPKDQDYQQLYQHLTGQTLYIPVEKDSLDDAPSAVHLGETLHSTDDQQVPMCSVAGPRGDSFVPLATTAANPMVANGYVGMRWLEALSTVMKIDTVEGVLLQGTNSWICIYKPQIAKILSDYSNTES